MRIFGQVQCAYWTHPDIQCLSDSAKLLGVYLLTGPHSNGIGAYRLPQGYLQADLGWSAETVSKLFRELFDPGFLERCEKTEVVWLPGYVRWNPIKNANVAKARQAEFEALPRNCLILGHIARDLKQFGNHWANSFETVLQTVAATVSKQDPIRSGPVDPVFKKDQDPPLKAPPRGSMDRMSEARSAIDRLNELTGSAFRATRPDGRPTANADKALALLKGGYTQADLVAVVERQAQAWAGTEQARYLRPETLFRRSKFESYHGQLGLPAAPTPGSPVDEQPRRLGAVARADAAFERTALFGSNGARRPDPPDGTKT